MAWIESHQSLANHPKTRKLARLLGVSRVTAIGHLHMLWWWAMEYAEDGDLSRFDAIDMAVACDWDGDETVLLEALTQAGFVDPDHRLHDWDDYAGRLLEQRRLHADRARRNKGLYNDNELIRIVRSRDGDNCRYCGRIVNWKDRRGAEGGTYDHVDPDAKPENVPENIVVACRACNSGKGRRTPELAGMALLPAGRDTADNGRKPAVNQPYRTVPYRTVPNRTEPEENDDDARGRATAAPSVVEHPFALLEALCDELGEDVSVLSKAGKDKQLAAAKRLRDDGLSADDVRKMTRWLRSQAWVTGGIDLLLLDKFKDRWRLDGKPERAPPNGRASPPKREDLAALRRMMGAER